MNDRRVAASILDACRKSAERFRAIFPKAPPEMAAACAAEFLTGVSQTAFFLTANDGGATPQQIERACALVASELSLATTTHHQALEQ